MMKDVMIGTWAWGPGNNGSKMVFGQNYDEKSLKDACYIEEHKNQRKGC